MADTALEEASAPNEEQQHAEDGEEQSVDPSLSGNVGGDDLDPSASVQSTSGETFDEGEGEGAAAAENGELEEGEEPMAVAEGNGEAMDGVEEGEEGMDVSEQGGKEEGEEEGEVGNGNGEGEDGQEEGELPEDAEEGEIFAEQVRFENQPDPATLAEIDTKLFVGGECVWDAVSATRESGSGVVSVGASETLHEI